MKAWLLWALEGLYWLALAYLPLQIVDLQVEIETFLGCVETGPCYKGSHGLVPPQMLYLYAAMLIWPYCLLMLRRLAQKIMAARRAPVEAEAVQASSAGKPSRRRRR